MGQQGRGRNTRVLWGMVLLAFAYGAMLHYLATITGVRFLDGVIGVAIGLYICSHPAANAVDILFFDRYFLQQISSNWSGLWWLGLNGLVMFAGWLVIVSGTARLVGGAA